MSAAAQNRAAPGRRRGRLFLCRLRLAFGFFTILPFSGAGPISEVAGAAYLLPVIGAVLGAIEGLVAWGSVRLFGSLVAGAAALAAALLLTGLHHADGLADVGDAVMAHGSRCRRLQVLKDQTLGIGAAGALLITYLLSWAAIAQLAFLRHGAVLVGLLAAAEVCARTALIFAAALSRPSHAGSGSEFIMTLRGKSGAAGFAAAFLILAGLALPLGVAALASALAAALLTAALVAAAARRLFGGAGGDVLGATLELARMICLLALLLALNVL